MRGKGVWIAGLLLGLGGATLAAEEKPVEKRPPVRETTTVVPVGAKEGSVLMIEQQTIPGGPPVGEEPPGPPAPEKSLQETVQEKVWNHVWEVSGGGWTWINPGGVGGFGILSLESLRDWDQLWLLRDSETQGVRFGAPIGFSMHWWSGPKGDALHPVPDLPARVYDLYLDMNWQTRWNPWLATEFRLAPGFNTDFKVSPPDGFRAHAHALGMITLSSELQAVFGAEYINRNDIKILPAVGFLWQPAEDLQCRLVFPHPKIAFCFSHWGKTDFWAYVSGEYGGGTWAYKYLHGEKTDWVEYSDYRIMIGIERRGAEEANRSFIEVGYLFERHINFVSALPDFTPKDTFLVRIGHRF
jgi:hypothetical protein